MGRRIGKGRLKNEEVSETSFPHDLSGNGLENQTRFVWDGSHLLQEIHQDGRYTYIYADQDSYEPLAQVRDWTTEDGESRQQTRYFHCDQIGIPREMTDKDGNLLWFGNYTGWGRLKEETRVTDTAYQPFRLQNQYADHETGLHYNFFRYYEPDAGRFVNQDPIGLMGGDNFYTFSPNTKVWVDWLGLCADLGKKLQNLVDESVAEIKANPKVAQNLMSAGSYAHLKNGTSLYAASFGKAVERLTARKIGDLPVAHTGTARGPNGRFISSPDFTSTSPKCSCIYDVTTNNEKKKHDKRYGDTPVTYLLYDVIPGLKF